MEQTGTVEVPYHDLWTKPFRENTDPSFLWLGPPYRDAFAALRSAVLQNAGVLLLTGEVGTGKTMLAGALADGLRAEGVRVGKLAYAGLHPEDFHGGVAQALGLPEGDLDFAARLADFLHQAYARREKVLLVIDEAQNLTPALLDEVDRVARAGKAAGRGKVSVINILLVGQIDTAVPSGGLAVALRCELRSLTRQEVADYVAFRLRVAGADRELFSSDTIAEIARASGGVPRLVNRMCDCALLAASRRHEGLVTADILREAIDDFGLATADGTRPLVKPGPRRRRRTLAVAGAAVLVLGTALAAVLHHGSRERVEAPATGAGDRHRDDSRLRAGDGVGGSATPGIADLPPRERAPEGPVARDEPPGGTPDTAAPRATSQGSGAAPRAGARPLVTISTDRRGEAAGAARAPTVNAPARSAARERPRRLQPDPTPAAPATDGSMPRKADRSDDPGAIIDWLLQGNRSAADR